VRSGADEDGRGVSVALTPDGNDAAARLRAARVRRMAALLDAVPDDPSAYWVRGEPH
jgi:hypothetical protein